MSKKDKEGMNQLRLFGPTSWTHPVTTAPAPHNGTPTSAAAARTADAASNRQRVADYLIGRSDGATDEQIADALGMRTQTEVPARYMLVHYGLVEDAGCRRTVRSGCNAIVWEYCGGAS